MKGTYIMQRGSRGFTLVELVVIIAILAVLAGIAVLRVGYAREEALQKTCYTDRALIARAYQLALIKNSSILLQDFIDQPESYGTYYSSKPICPAGGTYTAVNGKIICSHQGHDTEVAAGSSTAVEVSSNNLILTMKALAGIDSNKKSGIQLNSELKAALNGEFLPVEDYIIELAFGDKYTGSGLTWRTDSVNKTTIYFAADGGNDWSNWQAYLVVVNGVLYKTTKTHPYSGDLVGTNVAQLNSLSGDALAERLAKDFTVVGVIDY